MAGISESTGGVLKVNCRAVFHRVSSTALSGDLILFNADTCVRRRAASMVLLKAKVLNRINEHIQFSQYK